MVVTLGNWHRHILSLLFEQGFFNVLSNILLLATKLTRQHPYLRVNFFHSILLHHFIPNANTVPQAKTIVSKSLLQMVGYYSEENKDISVSSSLCLQAPPTSQTCNSSAATFLILKKQTTPQYIHMCFFKSLDLKYLFYLKGKINI